MVRGFLIGALAAASSADAQEAWVNPGSFYAFFDWSKPDLNADARANLDNAAAAYQQKPGRTVELIGRSDRSGTAAANLRFSRLRAQAVKAYLMTRAVPAERIQIRAIGETQPIIPTDDGVREAQNRSVELRFVAD